MLIGFALESRQAVKEMVSTALAAGGSAYAGPNDHGFMYQHGFEDLDGHIWEYFYMDPSHIQQ